MLAAMRRAVVSLSSPDLLSDAGARGASLRAVDDIAFGDCAAAVVLVEILRAHLEENGLRAKPVTERVDLI
jgi:hypothetical protein